MVVVFNCNGITDDHFSLSLNGTPIATMPEDDFSCATPPALCRGHLVVPTGWTSYPTPSSCGCTGGVRWITVTESAALDNPPCDMTFTLNSTQDNGCGNFGHFIVYRVCPVSGNTGSIEQIYFSSYGTFNTYNVSAPPGCCSDDSDSDSQSSSSSSSSSSSMSSSSISSSSVSSSISSSISSSLSSSSMDNPPSSSAVSSLSSEVAFHMAQPPQAYLINLNRRPDRLAAACKEIQNTSLKVVRVEAVDGRTTPMPAHWKGQGQGTWGCNRSHVKVLTEAAKWNHRTDWKRKVMVFEDDVTFVKDFDLKFKLFMDAVESLDPEWDAVFLGGQHMEPPIRINSQVLKCENVHRTHSYIIRGDYLQFMVGRWEEEAGHIDHVWGRNQKKWRVYAPTRWLCGQGASKSDVNGRQLGQRYWQPHQIKPCAGCGNKRQPRITPRVPANGRHIRKPR